MLTTTNRRGFLRALGVTAAALALDPELALWVPGRKTFFEMPGRDDTWYLQGIIDRAHALTLGHMNAIGVADVPYGNYELRGSLHLPMGVMFHGNGSRLYRVGKSTDPLVNVVAPYGGTLELKNLRFDTVYSQAPLVGLSPGTAQHSALHFSDGADSLNKRSIIVDCGHPDQQT